jgi:hypoxanthine phosphoribosyltransferase
MLNDRDKKDITPEKVYVTWDDVEEFITCASSYLGLEAFSKSYTGVYGPARGGLIFAVILSNRFNLPFLGAPQVGCICVDDICDTGDTALAWRNKGYTIATMFYKKGAKVTPDYWAKEKEDKWIVFPWE